MVWRCPNGHLVYEGWDKCNKCGAPKTSAISTISPARLFGRRVAQRSLRTSEAARLPPQPPSPPPPPEQPPGEGEGRRRRRGFFNRLWVRSRWSRSRRRVRAIRRQPRERFDERVQRVGAELSEKREVGDYIDRGTPIGNALRNIRTVMGRRSVVLLALILGIIILIGSGILGYFGGWSIILGIILIIVGLGFAIWGLLSFEREEGAAWVYFLAAIVAIGFGLYFMAIAPLEVIILVAAIAAAVILVWTSKKGNWKERLVVSVVLITGAILFYFGDVALTTLATSDLYRWIISGSIILVGGWLTIRTKKVEGKDKHTTAPLGIFLILLGLIFGFYFAKFGPVIITSLGDLAGFRWLIFLSIEVLGIILLFTNKGIGIFLIIFGIIFWFAIPFFSSTLFEKYGLKGEIVAEEAGIVKRLERFWHYMVNPEEYFAKFGRFDNPQAIEKKAPVGLKIEKFEPVVNVFRTDQDVKLTAEVKHFALPALRDTEQSTVTLGFSCLSNLTNSNGSAVPGIVSFARPGKTEIGNTIEIKRNTNATYFVFCTFNRGDIKSTKKQETKKVTLFVSYNNFVTESVLKAYAIGKDRYSELNSRENRDVEILHELRNAASYPGLINNERKTISEYSSGPVELGVSVLNEQPLLHDNRYTLIVSSRPNSIDWEGNIVPRDIFMEVPRWFKLEGLDDRNGESICSFRIGEPPVKVKQMRDSQFLIMTDSAKRILDRCATPQGCRYWCDFSVDGNFDTIEEHNLRVFQVTDYNLSKSTTFDYLHVDDIKPVFSSKDGVLEESAKVPMRCTSDSNCDDGNSLTLDICRDSICEHKFFECHDGIDNDNDGKIDYPYDIGCESLEDTDEFNLR